MPGRSYQAGSGSYRYSINGQEKSTEIDPDGNITTAQFWEYDSRTARRWNIDPKPTVGLSDYATFSNNPIKYSDPLGDKIITKNKAATDPAYKKGLEYLKNSATFKAFASQFDVGGTESFFGNKEDGKYAKNTNLIFTSEEGGANTYYAIYDKKGVAHYSNKETLDKLDPTLFDKDSRMDIIVNIGNVKSELGVLFNSKHEIGVHAGPVTTDMFLSALRTGGWSAMREAVKKGGLAKIAGYDPKTSLPILNPVVQGTGFANEWFTHGKAAAGENQFYNNLGKETLSQLNAKQLELYLKSSSTPHFMTNGAPFISVYRQYFPGAVNTTAPANY